MQLSRLLMMLAVLVSAACGRQSTPEAPASAAPASATDPAPAAVPMSEAEAAFAARFAGVALQGGAWDPQTGAVQLDAADGRPAYHIERLIKLADGRWALFARIDLHGVPLTLPVPVTIDHLDDSAAVTVDAVAFPGMGTFSARFILDENAYAGTWSGAGKHGTFFGRVIREERP